MKKFWSLVAVTTLSAGLALFAQNGNGRGNPPANPPAECPNPNCPNYPNCPGTPGACDKDADGICDYTGLPVGQCRQSHAGRGQGKGSGRGAACPRAGAGSQSASVARR